MNENFIDEKISLLTAKQNSIRADYRNLSRPNSTREVLDSILRRGNEYKSAIENVKSESKRIERGGFLREVSRPKNFPTETEFMHKVSRQQSEREKFLSDKRAETENLRQQVKREKSATERDIKIFCDKLKGELRCTNT